MAQVSYQIKLFDNAGANKALFVGRGRYGPASTKQGTLISFNFWKRLRTAGSFTLTIDGRDDRIAEFVEDAVIVIERRDITTSGPFVKVFEGFHRAEEFTRLQDGTDRFISRGRAFNDLLQSDVILGDVGSAVASKSGAAETVAKSYVDQNIGPNANNDDLGNSRVRSGLAIQADTATGSTWSGDRAYSNLLDALIEIADFTANSADFAIQGNDPSGFDGNMTFVWEDGQLGLDKTKGNTDGNPPVIFSPQRNNVQRISVFDSRLDEVNAVYVVGQGVGAQRQRVTRVDALPLAASLWARRAVARDASDETTLAGLNSRGDETLERQKARMRTSFQVLQSPGTRYVRDWDVGDLVTVEYRDFSIDQKVIGVRVSLSSNGEENIVVETDDI